MSSIKLQPLDVICYKRHKFHLGHTLIKWRSLGSYYHTSIVSDKELIFDPIAKGVMHADFSRYKNNQCAVMRYKKEFDVDKVLEWCYRTYSESHGYDFLAWLGFTTGIKSFEESNRWYCSEFAYYAFQANGYKLTNRDLTFIYPQFFYDCNDFQIIYEGNVSNLKTSN